MLVYHSQVSLEEGYFILSHVEKCDRTVGTLRVSRPSGWLLYQHLQGSTMKCWCCETVADRWVANKGRYDHVGPPVLDLFGTDCNGQVVLMTRDHIIPKSLGGIDAVANLRVGCAPCNFARANDVTVEDVKFAKDHPELVCDLRIAAGLKGLQNRLARLLPFNEHFASDMKKPFEMMGYL